MKPLHLVRDEDYQNSMRYRCPHCFNKVFKTVKLDYGLKGTTLLDIYHSNPDFKNIVDEYPGDDLGQRLGNVGHRLRFQLRVKAIGRKLGITQYIEADVIRVMYRIL